MIQTNDLVCHFINSVTYSPQSRPCLRQRSGQGLCLEEAEALVWRPLTARPKKPSSLRPLRLCGEQRICWRIFEKHHLGGFEEDDIWAE